MKPIAAPLADAQVQIDFRGRQKAQHHEMFLTLPVQEMTVTRQFTLSDLIQQKKILRVHLLREFPDQRLSPSSRFPIPPRIEPSSFRFPCSCGAAARI